jgi:hypothetical protein
LALFAPIQSKADGIKNGTAVWNVVPSKVLALQATEAPQPVHCRTALSLGYFRHFTALCV